MKSMFGLEIQCAEDKPQYFQNLLLQLKEIASIFDSDDSMLITDSAMEAKVVKNMLMDRSILEETYSLSLIENPIATSLFTDYGFVSEKNNHYLYQDMISIFGIESGKQVNIDMFLIQLEESIIAIEEQYKKSYIIDKENQEFMLKVARAYDIEVSIFDLDK
ncbi:MAG: hypothetical protein U9Q88_11310 [Bacillota bacterium]|uniref:hypothetical protein n=1 Tax=Bacillus sp. RO2 TaxID=2723913 RepID=UPI00145FB4AD|nr:hypothetical protein [Bacillus sp. RO2]MEA3320609.1 hypothetical protein [Bacillota bacterium]NMH74428.1 hypothetical protein [Bacillus sp. RO2]